MTRITQNDKNSSIFKQGLKFLGFYRKEILTEGACSDGMDKGVIFIVNTINLSDQKRYGNIRDIFQIKMGCVGIGIPSLVFELVNPVGI